MQVKIALFLGFVGSIGAMELSSIKPQNRQEPVVQVTKETSDHEDRFKKVAQILITKIDFFKGKYPEKKIVKTLMHFQEKYETSYADFLEHLMVLQSSQDAVTNNAQARETVNEKDLTIQFLDMMYKLRYQVARTHKELHKKLADQHSELQTQHTDLQAQHQTQIKKTQRSNLWALGVTIGGTLTTVITGLLTWYLKVCVTTSTTPPA